MLNQEKLNTLNEANKLLNQKHAKLGLKPMMISGTHPEAFRAALERKLLQKALGENTSAREGNNPTVFQQENTNALDIPHEHDLQVRGSRANDYLSSQQQEEPAKAVSKTLTNFQQKEKPKANIFALIIPLALFAAIAFGAYYWWTNSLSADKDYDTITISSENRSLAICTGLYAKRSDAEAHKEAVERITGDTVRIIKTGKSYTLQIGASYKHPEDAYLVFDELLKYPLKDLSVRAL